MRCKSQVNTVFIAIHPTTYGSERFLAHGVLKKIASAHIQIRLLSVSF